MGRPRTIVLLIVISLSLISCSFAPEDALRSGRPAEFPDMLLIDTRYLLAIEDSEPIKIQADQIEMYREAHKAYITDATFTQHDREGTLVFSGSFNEAVVDTQTNDMELSGDVMINNHREEFTVSAGQLSWEHVNQMIRGGEDTLVTLTRKEHDILRGTGFRGDFSRVTFEFSTMEEGVVHYE